MTEPLQIHTLGRLTIQQGTTPIEGFISRKVDALLVYLAYTEQPQPREILASLLWPEHNQSQALANLRMALSSLKQHLEPYLVVTRQTVGLDEAQAYQLDVAELNKQLSIAEERWTQAGSLSRAAAAQLEEALKLYQGDFLAGFYLRDSQGFEDWMLMEREHLKQRVMAALHQIVQSHLKHGLYADGMAQANRLLQLDPLREETHCLLMMLQAQMGQRSAALVQYEACRRLLNEELGVEPSEETVALYEEIESGAYTVPQAQRPVLPGNFPAPSTPFVSRDTELAQISALLEDPDCRLLTLVGPGGTGKTRLALQAATDSSSVFPDGVYFVPLAAVNSPDFLPFSIAAMLSASLTSQGDTQVQLLNYLRTKRVLLVLDSFEHLMDGTTLIDEILKAAPRVKILVTSRERLNMQNEWLLPVEGMQYPRPADADPGKFSALQLFEQSARRVQLKFSLEDNTQAVIRICELVEGMPLGIELAAGWLRMMPCDQIARQIERDLDFLATSIRNVPERHRSLRALSDHSWNLLTDRERSVFMKLALFRGGFVIEAAEEIAGASLPIMAALVEKSLVRASLTGRYDVHEILRRYILDKLQESGQIEKISRKVYDYFCKLAESNAPVLRGANQAPALQTLTIEHDNLRAALSSVIEKQDAEKALRLAVALLDFWEIGGYTDEGRRWLDQVLALSAGPEQLRVNALNGAGMFAWSQGDFAPARQMLEESLTLRRTLPDKAGLSAALDNLGHLYLNMGDHAGARAFYEESLILHREQKDKDDIASLLDNLGLVASELGDHAGARKHYEESLALARELGNRRSAAVIMANLGIVLLKQSEYEQAQKLFEENLDLMRALNSKLGTAIALSNLGDIAQVRGDYARASIYYRDCLPVFQDLQDEMSIAGVLDSVGRMAKAQGQPDQAVLLYGAANRLRESTAVPLSDREAAEREQEIVELLKAGSFAAAWQQGQELTLAEAVDCARQVLLTQP
jgi:predicted ATPase/DNA-binding SARP family transcriptional activator